MNKRKVMQFIDSNFPPYNKCTIVQECGDETVAVLDYGKNDKVQIRIGCFDDSHSLYRLLQTDFI